MTQYISKSALVAEIESKFQKYWKRGEESDALQDGNAKYWGGVLSCLNEVKTLIDTLEMKDFWKSADGDDLPEIDREVVALLGNGKVGFAHRPPEYWDGKNIITGKVTRNYPKTYDKGGWNIPNIKYWLDVELPKEIEL